ncbi:MAG TPA: hypothetical protein P5250_02010 [Bacteroidales bacterium]|nr:hypothetical protein [Bacteroidales bacterium]
MGRKLTRGINIPCIELLTSSIVKESTIVHFVFIAIPLWQNNL